MNLKYKTVAVDFDGTLTYGDNYPMVKDINIWAVIALIAYKRAGGTLLLFTCRTDFALEEALRECSKYGLYFDEVNRTTQKAINEWRENHPHSSISSKVSADLYIDDKAYPNNITGIDWTLLSRELLKEEGA